MKDLFKINLRMFDEGTNAAENVQVADGQNEVVENDLNTADNQVSSQEAKVEDFDTLIKGKYKEDFDKKVQSILNRRLRGHNELKESVDKTQPILDVLATRYKLDSTDLEGILNSLNRDDMLLEDIANEMGLSVDGYRHVLKQESENKRLRTALEQTEREREFNAKWENWMSQVGEVEALYSDFDFENELQNQQFLKLIDNGISLKSAYEACHSDEILQGAIAYTAKRVRKQTADDIATRGTRAIENGISNGAGISTKVDISKMTKEERAKLALRAARGETISF